MVKDFFMDRFRTKHRVLIRLDNVHFKSISCKENALLMGRILEKEINEAIWNCEVRIPNRMGLILGLLNDVGRS